MAFRVVHSRARCRRYKCWLPVAVSVGCSSGDRGGRRAARGNASGTYASLSRR